MNKCCVCGCDCEGITILADTGFVTDVYGNTSYYCNKCVNNKVATSDAVYYKGKYYYKTHQDVTTCDNCGRAVHRNVWMINNCCCNRCMQQRSYRYPNMRYCPNCEAYHTDGTCNGGLEDVRVNSDTRLQFTVRKESKSRDPKGGEASNDKYIESIGQYQTERDLAGSTSDLLKKFYHSSKSFNHYYTREPVHITGTVKYNNTKILSDVKYALSMLRIDREKNIRNCKKVSKYSNYYLKGLNDEGLIQRNYIDIMGNIRERCESVNKFFQDIGEKVTNTQMTGEFNYILSSDINHKIEAFKLNDKVGSCQKSHNYDSYARGAYDAITNGCNCPILLYNPGSTEPFARITTRIMYDKEGQEYILIDRIYHSGEFSDSAMKGAVYKGIVKDLKDKGYKVIASNYSAHDESTYAYLASLGMRSETVIQDLCQPLRRLVGGYGYYCDGGTVVRTGIIDDIKRATDYLDKAYLL